MVGGEREGESMRLGIMATHTQRKLLLVGWLLSVPATAQRKKEKKTPPPPGNKQTNNTTQQQKTKQKQTNKHPPPPPPKSKRKGKSSLIQRVELMTAALKDLTLKASSHRVVNLIFCKSGTSLRTGSVSGYDRLTRRKRFR